MCAADVYLPSPPCPARALQAAAAELADDDSDDDDALRRKRLRKHEVGKGAGKSCREVNRPFCSSILAVCNGDNEAWDRGHSRCALLCERYASVQCCARMMTLQATVCTSDGYLDCVWREAQQDRVG